MMIFHTGLYIGITIVALFCLGMLLFNRSKHSPQRGTMLFMCVLIFFLSIQWLYWFSSIPHCTCKDRSSYSNPAIVIVKMSKHDYEKIKDLVAGIVQ